jgi:DNA repair photolyase
LDEETCKIIEIECKSLLNKSGLADYAVNCYTGCEHGCRYCYARFVTRFSHPGEPWGGFVDVKVNAPAVLAREVKRKKVGRVFISSVCDGWQPVESNYRLTRQCLEILLSHGFPVSILTKNALAQRDLDLLKSKDSVELGSTLTTLDENLFRLFEPRSSPPEKRLTLLQEAKSRGIETYVFLGPLLPYLSDSESSILSLLKAVKEVGADYFYVDRLNLRFGVWKPLLDLLQQHFPQLTEDYRHILFNASASDAYSQRLASIVNRLAAKEGLDTKLKLCL